MKPFEMTEARRAFYESRRTGKRMDPLTCAQCRGEFRRYVRPSRPAPRFCSSACFGAANAAGIPRARRYTKAQRWKHFLMMWGWLGARALLDGGPTQSV